MTQGSTARLQWCMKRWALRRKHRGESTDLDERGLVPLEVARAILDEHRVMQSGGPRYFGGPVREGAYRCEYLIWGSLLSLDSAEEFLERAETIRWMEGPGIVDNALVLERFGEAVKPWLLAHVRDGVLVNVPRGIQSSLLALDGRDVFDVLWRVRDFTDSVDESSELVSRHFRGPPEGWTILASDPPTFAEPDRAPYHLVDPNIMVPFVRNHPETGVPALLERHEAGEERATELLRTILTSRYDHMRVEAADALVEAAVGPKGLKALKKKPRRKLTAEQVLGQLDACWSGEENTAWLSWPWFRMDTSREVDEYHALRLIAVRGTGASWALIFQRLAGVPFHPHDPVQLQSYTYGSECELGQDEGDAFRLTILEDPGGDGLEGVVLDGVGGELTLHDDMIDALDLRRGQSVEPHGAHHRANLMLRAYLAAHPDAPWSTEEPKRLAKTVLEKGKVLLVADAFQHVGAGPGEDGATPPSESPVFQSLAAALVNKDASLFEPGESNLDWRLHAVPSPDAGPVQGT